MHVERKSAPLKPRSVSETVRIHGIFARVFKLLKLCLGTVVTAQFSFQLFAASVELQWPLAIHVEPANPP